MKNIWMALLLLLLLPTFNPTSASPLRPNEFQKKNKVQDALESLQRRMIVYISAKFPDSSDAEREIILRKLAAKIKEKLVRELRSLTFPDKESLLARMLK